MQKKVEMKRWVGKNLVKSLRKMGESVRRIRKDVG